MRLTPLGGHASGSQGSRLLVLLELDGSSWPGLNGGDGCTALRSSGQMRVALRAFGRSAVPVCGTRFEGGPERFPAAVVPAHPGPPTDWTRPRPVRYLRRVALAPPPSHAGHPLCEDLSPADTVCHQAGSTLITIRAALVRCRDSRRCFPRRRPPCTSSRGVASTPALALVARSQGPVARRA